MDQGVDEFNAIPNCVCGNGRMLRKIVGSRSIHPGRAYYKCPVNGNHKVRFHLCDEYHQNAPAHMLAAAPMLQAPPVAAPILPSPQAQSRMLTPHFVMQIRFVFMAIVLVLLGIIIGKLI